MILQRISLVNKLSNIMNIHILKALVYLVKNLLAMNSHVSCLTPALIGIQYIARVVPRA